MFSLWRYRPSAAKAQSRRRKTRVRPRLEDLEGKTLLTAIPINFGATVTSAPVAVGGELFFVAQDAAHGKQVWGYNTTQGATRITDGNDARGGINPKDLTAVGNALYFAANNGLAFFGQDDFCISQTLTVNYGMRWEYFGPLGEKSNLLSNLGADGNLAMVGTDGLKHAYNRDLNNFGPRFGFAYNLTASGHHILRGGYGIYFGQIFENIPLFTEQQGNATVFTQTLNVTSTGPGDRTCRR